MLEKYSRDNAVLDYLYIKISLGLDVDSVCSFTLYKLSNVDWKYSYICDFRTLPKNTKKYFTLLQYVTHYEKNVHLQKLFKTELIKSPWWKTGYLTSKKISFRKWNLLYIVT